MLEEIEKYAYDNNIPIMQKDGIEFLCNYIKDNNVKNILEIGSAIGYSSIKMAKVNDDIKITTIERDFNRYNIAVSNINKFGLNNRINIINKDANEVIIDGYFDLIFIDAAKASNINFFEKFSKNLAKNGTIITDNLSFHGLVEDNSLVKTKNQKGLVNKIRKYIEFLDNNKDFNTTYVDVGDKISITKRNDNINNFIVAPSSYDNLENLLNKNIKAILIGIDKLSVSPLFKMNIDDIIKLANNTDKEIFVSMNKMMHNKDLKLIEEVLVKINNSKISKVLFYDLSVLNIAKKIKINKDLVISQEHLNASINTNDFYYKRGVNYSLITSDITYEEINEIAKSSKINLITTVYGYLPIFYSRRYLITNYLDYINKDKKDSIYYLKHNEDYYLIKEEEEGTLIYTKEPINLINDYLKLENISYYLIDGSFMEDNDFIKVVDNYINKVKQDNTYIGFFDVKTTYKVKKDE